MALPRVRPNSGSFFGPKRSNARIKMNTVSCQPSGPIEFVLQKDSSLIIALPKRCHYREMAPECLFCQIAAHSHEAALVFEQEQLLAFLDHRPLFPGHTLLIPKTHVETLA